MVKKRKVCVVTGTRAEYGLLYWLLKGIEGANELELQLIVTGMHLSPEFGLTYKQIEEDGFKIDQKVEMLLSSDTPVAISKSMGLAMAGFADAYERMDPDIVVVLGDRFEIFSAASASLIGRIPLAHIHGGETTEGAFDEAMRHSITKMSHLHFTSTEEYRNRVIQLGEQPDRVFTVGSLGIDNIHKFNLLSRPEFEKSIDFKLGEQNIIVTFHPVTLENSTAQQQFSNLLQALDELHDTHIIFTKANADTDGRIINKMIDDYVMERSGKTIAYTSLGQIRYLSALKYVDAVVGNSSSGIIEAPSFKIPTINIGDRQKGRVRAESVCDCNETVEGIREALTEVFTDSYQKKVASGFNPYEKSGTADRIVEILSEYSLQKIIKKEFFDIKTEG